MVCHILPTYWYTLYFVPQLADMAHESFHRTENASCANSGIEPKLADMAHESLYRAENASCANFGIEPELAGHNQP